MGVLSCLVIVKVSATNEMVELAACDYRPKEEELVVRFCPRLNYTVVLECSVKTKTLEWKSLYFKENVTFYTTDKCNASRMEDPFSFNLIKTDVNENSLVSQLRVSTIGLKHHLNGNDRLTVTCHAAHNMQRMVLIEIAGKITLPSLRGIIIFTHNTLLRNFTWSDQTSTHLDNVIAIVL